MKDLEIRICFIPAPTRHRKLRNSHPVLTHRTRNSSLPHPDPSENRNYEIPIPSLHTAPEIPCHHSQTPRKIEITKFISRPQHLTRNSSRPHPDPPENRNYEIPIPSSTPRQKTEIETCVAESTTYDLACRFCARYVREMHFYSVKVMKAGEKGFARSILNGTKLAPLHSEGLSVREQQLLKTIPHFLLDLRERTCYQGSDTFVPLVVKG